MSPLKQTGDRDPRFKSVGLDDRNHLKDVYKRAGLDVDWSTGIASGRGKRVRIDPNTGLPKDKDILGSLEKTSKLIDDERYRKFELKHGLRSGEAGASYGDQSLADAAYAGAVEQGLSDAQIAGATEAAASQGRFEERARQQGYGDASIQAQVAERTPLPRSPLYRMFKMKWKGMYK